MIIQGRFIVIPATDVSWTHAASREHAASLSEEPEVLADCQYKTDACKAAKHHYGHVVIMVLYCTDAGCMWIRHSRWDGGIKRSNYTPPAGTTWDAILYPAMPAKTRTARA